MISKVEIDGIATFKSRQILDGLKAINYFFGANGSGKTTISRVIDAPVKYDLCSVSWVNQAPLETRVYNRNFMERNFNQPIPGVFTLGPAAKETLNKIKATKEDIRKNKKISTV